jgi:tetratricopeptide (TPR) repeat protein
MVKATAISLLQNDQDPAIVPVLRRSLTDPDPLIRYAAVSALFAADDNTLLELALPRLDDSVKLIRTTAAFQLARVPREYFAKSDLRKHDRVLQEYIQTQRINADHPSAHMNLGILAFNQGNYTGAEAEYRKAIEIEPALTTPYVNLADLYRVMNRDREGEQILRDALKQDPDMAAVNYALGLNLVRRGASEEAMAYLEKAASLEPENARYAYVFGVGLNSVGKRQESIAYLEGALLHNPYDRDLLYALATFSHEMGNREAALDYAGRLLEYYPSDPEYMQLIQLLRRSPQ